ncbi:MAG: substrate-binding domain-containing protein [Tannerellaceae bacterium]|nr:substrate-binding domain-containing protein [Tannerellaceae bacterium]
MKNIFLFLALLLLFVACNEKTPVYRIGISQCSDDEWRTKMNNEILREAQFYEGVEVEIRSVKDDSRAQIQDIRYFIDAGVDLLIVSPNEAVPITPIVEEAFSRNIPVVVVDRMILSDKYTAFIGADNYEIGRSVGDYLVSRFPEGGKIVELSGLSGSTPAINRHQGFMSVISKHPAFRVLTTRDAEWLSESATRVMEQILKEEPDIDILFAHNDRMAAGAYIAASRANREKEMKFLGIDALPGTNYGLDLVLQDILEATFIYPTDGDKVMRLAMDILQNKPYERENILFTAAIGETNARVMKQQSDHIEELDKKIRFLNSNMDRFLVRFANQRMILYANLVILGLLLIIIVLVFKAYRTKHKLNEELSRQRDQLLELSKQLEEATHAKLVFFTNISHDFRTPLTLIADPVNQLLEDPSIPEQPKGMLKLVRKNTNILLRLVNQILDFRKYENGKLDLVPISFNMKEQLEDWVSAFTPIALKKHIRFRTLIDEEADYRVTADLGKIERVCYNLLSNAFKFTPENGKITVRLSTWIDKGEKYVQLSVEDNGIGISAQHVKNIFERFYMSDYQYAGSGIGLALSKAFIELHKGTITVESAGGTGSLFTFRIPVTQPGYSAFVYTGEISSDNNSISLREDMESILPVENLSEKAEATGSSFAVPDQVREQGGEYSILIIDDNADIRNYLRATLQNNYTILEAENGKEGVKMAMKYVPDVVICDILMPVMDGIECCKMLKTELQTSHIPVIMLTACSLDEQRIVGFETGADSYIAKPFNAKVLEARVRNLINNRTQLKQYFGDSTTLAKEAISDLDKVFVEKFKKIIEENISNSGFSVEDMSGQLGMSRVQVYRKIKSLTNYAPNELLRISRLKKAASLLASTQMSIAEITYEVGFTSPSYFTKCYKEHFGENPREFLKRKG